jgi:hypothetical protein
VPFGYNFLLFIAGDNILLFRPRRLKASSLYALVMTAWFLQYFGFYALGTVYDPVDIAMYASGILLAVFFDQYIFPSLIPFWED